MPTREPMPLLREDAVVVVVDADPLGLEDIFMTPQEGEPVQEGGAEDAEIE
jgi:hypothetical protein